MGRIAVRPDEWMALNAPHWWAFASLSPPSAIPSGRRRGVAWRLVRVGATAGDGQAMVMGGYEGEGWAWTGLEEQGQMGAMCVKTGRLGKAVGR